MTAVVGVTPTGKTFAPSSAFTNVVLPWLNSPTTTRLKRSASSFSTRSEPMRPPSVFAPTRSARRRRSLRDPITSMRLLWKLSSMVGLAYYLDDFVDLLIDLCHRKAARAEVRVAPIELALGEDLERPHPLGEPGVARRELRDL